ncbi:30S ribosomal protein S5 [Candidatus Peregrinibacteria bacterium]|nr:30S ribosomal protein S5 [Candidatus Peregrinibacteria bacterium]
MAKKNQPRGPRHEKEPKEFEEEVLQIDRVTRVVKGGRRLRFRCLVAIGDKKGRVGIGIGKATEVVNGIKKAVTKAKKNLIKVPITDTDTIPHEIKIKHKSARLFIMPASSGTGVIAGGSLRKILNLAGVKNVLSKSYGTNNKVVTAQASIKALQRLRPARKAKKIEDKKEKPVESKKETSEKPVKKEPNKEKKEE